MKSPLIALLALWLSLNSCAGDAPPTPAPAPVTITAAKEAWTLSNEALDLRLAFKDGSLQVVGLLNKAAKRDYLAGRAAQALFTHTVAGQICAANDGKWSLGEVKTTLIEVFGKTWGKRLEITLSRGEPVAFSVRQVFELYEGGALRCLSFVKNGTEQPLALGASEVFSLNLPDEPHQVHFVTGNVMWNVGSAGVHRNGRTVQVNYSSGDGWFLLPENNWATSTQPGPGKGSARDKLLYIHAWDQEAKVRVSSNPAAVQVTLFPREELEYFAVNFGVYQGDATDGRMAAAEHLRRRFKFINPVPVISTNDWQWGEQWGRRTEALYRSVVIPQAKAAGFDRVLFDDGWYAPDDSTTPKPPVANMAALTQSIVDNGMKTGHWFSLQGHFCTRGWANGRDAADPANIDFKLKQLQEELIGKYHCNWDQVDAGLFWKTDQETPYSHPMDSVYRKILGAKRYMNTVAHRHPDFIMQTTCEVDNPGGPGEEGLGAGTHGVGNQNIGLIQLADNGIAGMFKRTEYADDVRDLFADFGLFPLEGMLSTHGEDGLKGDNGWQDSPLWYYQFLLARHTMIYSWPGDWSPASVQHFRSFNDWRRNPRMQALLSKIVQPVYKGPDPVKNAGPWCWMVADAAKSEALVFAINHRELNPVQSFAAKLRWLDPAKTYFIEEITQLSDGSSHYAYRGEFSGAALKQTGLPVDLDAGEERCAAFFVKEKQGEAAQLLYADAAVTSVTTSRSGAKLSLELRGNPGATAQLIVAKPAKQGVEARRVVLDATGQARLDFADDTITERASPMASSPPSTNQGRRDLTTGGAWQGQYGSLAAWRAGDEIKPQGDFSLRTAAPVYIWPGDVSAVPRVLAAPGGPKSAACWTTAESFKLRVAAPAERRYRLSVYVMDYDNGQRGMDLTVKSADGKLYDRQSASVTECGQGVYLSWDVTGPATVTAKKTAGANAAVSGVFIDATKP